MIQGGFRAEGVMLQMFQTITRWLVVSVCCVGLAGCEEEPPPMQRGGGPDPAGTPSAPSKPPPAEAKKNQPAAGPAEKGKQPTATAKADKGSDGEGQPAGEAPAGPAAKPSALPPRVPSASEMLGMDRDDNAAAADRLPTFLANPQAENRLLADGQEPTPR